ncbi:putative secondary metabolism biosynthetic enzyme [Recurvomyces mirabilis]|uniref:Secondary metabolism biosynthetic enzyme n=1 Tax=Recurvomyces mirabilis TaxID=574656 RepID=A0AAE1C473_9PEZI|nr:putative secondary metabolism biosynthetic enzyme [Recurvomyces mirabilis]KAK5159264.1 hypothetical protein LTS14_002406 [Recurvomyces mirabilis]
MGSKSLTPRHESFFPTFFYRTQFKEKHSGLPRGLDLTSQTAIITGANAGLGFECCKQLLALHLSHLILAVRSPTKGETAAAVLRKQYPKAKIEVWQLDMCSYKSVQAFAQRVEQETATVDIVVLNAGIVKPSYTPAPETGHEESMQVNYLSTVLLAILLLPTLQSKRAPGQPPARLTMVNSGLSLTGKFPLNPKKPGSPILASFDDAKPSVPRPGTTPPKPSCTSSFGD